jgi:hypothetical protein
MVINVKWGVYAAVVALLLAFTTSIALGQASFVVALLRALVFAALFFVLGTGTWALINNFIPELLFPEANDAAANIFGPEIAGLQASDSQLYGSQVNITLGDRGDAALPENDGSDAEDVGNIADLVSGAVDPAEEAKRQRGLDGINENSYTDSGGDVTSSLNDFAEPLPAAEESGGFAMNFDSLTMGGGTSGLEPFGDSFSLPPDSGRTAREEEIPLPERKVTGNKPMALEGDFNPKDIALGIRTVLENDKKG